MNYIDPELTTDLDDDELVTSSRSQIQEETEELRCRRYEEQADTRELLLSDIHAYGIRFA